LIVFVVRRFHQQQKLAGINIAQPLYGSRQTTEWRTVGMKEVGNSIAQLFAIIMILITLAVSTAAVSQWFGADTATNETGATTQTQSQLLASGTR
jgi:hypothetical protein